MLDNHGKAMAPDSLAPNGDCEALLNVIEGDVAAYMAKDIERLSDFYVQDERMISIMQIAGTGLIRCWGWKEFEALLRKNLSGSDAPSKANVRRDNIRLKVQGDMAYAHFEQYVTNSQDAMDPPAFSHNVRVFERIGEQWLIVFHGVFEPSSEAQRAPSVEVDEDANVLSMNPAAAERLSTFDGLTISAGVLRAVRPSWDKQLRGAIARAAELRAYTQLHREVGRGQHAVLPVVLGENEMGGSVVCLVEVTDFSVWVTFDDHEMLRRKLSLARAVYGLSDGQVALAHHIAEGRDLATAAEELGITVNTARTHLRRMFDKTGVRSQTALLRVILSHG